MTKAEEIARGLFNCLSRDRYLTEAEHDRIVAALREYGAEVRKRDAEIPAIMSNDRNAIHLRSAQAISAAIGREELP